MNIYFNEVNTIYEPFINMQVSILGLLNAIIIVVILVIIFNHNKM